MDIFISLKLNVKIYWHRFTCAVGAIHKLLQENSVKIFHGHFQKKWPKKGPLGSIQFEITIHFRGDIQMFRNVVYE